MKLAKRELLIIKAMQDGAFAYYTPYQGRFNPHEYYSVEEIGKCTREMKKLIKMGLVIEKQKGLSRWDLYLSDEGKNFKCEIDEFQDIWIFDNIWNRISKSRGYLSGSTLVTENGQKIKQNHNIIFFKNREGIYNHAIERKKTSIRATENQIKRLKRELLDLQNQFNDPESDV